MSQHPDTYRAFHEERLSQRGWLLLAGLALVWPLFLVVAGPLAVPASTWLLLPVSCLAVGLAIGWPRQVIPAVLLLSLAFAVASGRAMLDGRPLQAGWLALAILGLAALMPLPAPAREIQTAIWALLAAAAATLADPVHTTLLDLASVAAAVAVSWAAQRAQTRGWQKSWEDADIQNQLMRRLAGARDALADAVRQTREELAEQHRQLASQERLAALGRLAAGIAHEINNPLTVALTNLDMAREDADPDLLEDAMAALARIRNIVADVSRAMRPVEQGVSEPVSVIGTVRYAVQTASIALNGGPEVEIQVPDDLAVLAHQGRLEQVLVNLVVNAGQAIEGGGGRVMLHVEQRDGRVLIHADDDGPGIPESAMEQIFEPFFTTKREGGGTGLGLPLSRSYLRAMGGDLRASHSPQGGARLTVDLPRATLQAQPAPAARRRSQPGRPPPVVMPEGTALPAVLVVDDEPALRRALGRCLQAEWTVLAAGSLQEALELAAKHEITAVLCDLVLPEGDGVEVLRALAAREPRILHHTLLMTGEPTHGHLLAVARRNAEHLVRKPFDPTSLRERLQRARLGHRRPIDLDPPTDLGQATPFAPPSRTARPGTPSG